MHAHSLAAREQVYLKQAKAPSMGHPHIQSQVDYILYVAVYIYIYIYIYLYVYIYIFTHTDR